MTTALEQLTQSALAATVQSAPEVPKYTLEEALPLVKKQFNLFSLDDLSLLLPRVRKMFEAVIEDEKAVCIINHYTRKRNFDDGCDFFDDCLPYMDDFLQACEHAENDYDIGDFNYRILDDFVDSSDIRDYFNDHSDDFFDNIEDGYDLCYSDILDEYFNDNTMDIDEQIDLMRLSNY